MKIIIANSAQYFKEDLKNIFQANNNIKYWFINQKSQLNFNDINRIQPDYIFFMHWSYIIDKEIYSNFECIIFHMTDLPFGRGGSPLQNLLSRGIYETKISAIRCVKALDAGDIYLKRHLTLNGSAEEIYRTASKIMYEMMQIIIEKQPQPQKQIGDPVVFQRRSKQQSNIRHLSDLEAVFNHIRMLDADGYPSAYVETDYFVCEFERAAFKGDRILADVTIRLKSCQK